MNKKLGLVAILCVALAVTAGIAVSASPATNDSIRIVSVINEMKSLDPATLESLPPIEIKPYTLPPAGIDVMRVHIEETYTIEGVGKDTVQLTGWVAVRHGAFRPGQGENKVTWSTAVADTEFVGLELKGQSAVFGPIEVTLDSSRPAIGQVGKISVPERAGEYLLAANDTATTQKDTTQDTSAVTEETATTDAEAAKCRAPVNVNVSMPKLGLDMKTKEPVVWYSRVTTIPPVGHTASVTIDPVTMTSGGRKVGSLVSGQIKFREVVKSVPLSKDHAITVAP